MNKIAFLIISDGWGGLEMNTIKLAQEFELMNYQVFFITAKDTKVQKEAHEVFDKVISIDRPKKYFDFKSAGSLSKILRNENIQTIILTNNRDIDVLSITKRFFNKKLSIIFQQQMQIGVNKKDLIHTFRYKSLKYWISPLNSLKKEVLEKTRIPEEKIQVIPLGINTHYFTKRVYSKVEALQKLNIPESNEPLIGIIGRIDRKKGQLFIIKAVNELRNRNIKVQLLIFGSPTILEDDSNTYFAEMHEFVHNNKMENEIHFREFNKDVKQFYDAIDIFALASLSETYGMVTVEAMASGLNIVATQSGGTPEILNNGEFGLLYDYENMDEFCAKVQWILSNSETANNISSRAVQEVIAHYDEKKTAKEISNLVSEL
jgi:glycosyltransferase involved in cell wall biosynthesis